MSILISKLTAHKSISRNVTGTDWLCGDLHGQYDALQSALADVAFNTTQNRLFLLGDVVDRGPRSKELLS
ncbi:MAG: metallophosphoesterase [Marinobacter sp.]|nr:metallophosphoesterase [Marinobacter sp.]